MAGRTPIQNVASLPLNVAYNGAAPEKVIFIGRERQKAGKEGVKWVHFQGRMVAKGFQGRMALRRLLKVTPFTLLSQWLRAPG